MNKKKRSVFSKPKKKPFIVRFIRKLLLISVMLTILVGSAIYFILYASLPEYDGEVQLTDLGADVSITRDDLGTVSISAENRTDLARALGWSHGQERFFQMDLQRRRAAGELSEIIGAATVKMDKRVRLHRFRHRAQRIIEQLPASHLALIKAYTQGVNSGLNALTTSPPEYWALQVEPETWTPEDTILVVFSMYLQLQHSSVEREKVLQNGFQHLPEAVFDFLVPQGTEFDAAIDFSELSLPKIPGVNDGTHPPNNRNTDSQNGTINDSEAYPGSNNFAINGPRTKNQSAIVASDMHLSHGVPNVWYKVNLSYQSGTDLVELNGVSLPGTPLLIAGTNKQIAWAFTNSYGDYSDTYALQLHPENKNLYQYQNEWHEFHFANEVINIKNQKPETITIKQSILGPVEKIHNNRAWALLWVAHDVKAINFNLLQFETVKNVQQAIALAPTVSIPAQNLVVADDQGNIGWTVIGPLPKRRPGANPLTTIEHKNGVINWLSADEYPKIVNPESHALWTANGRIVGGDDFAKIGNGGYAMGARGAIIKNRLLALNNANEADLLKIQLETEASLYQRWQKHLISLLKQPGNRAPKYHEMLSLLEQWNGKADANQVGFTLLKQYRRQLRQILLDPWVESMDPDAKFGINYYSKQYEYSLWKIVENQPKAFLPEGFEGYNSVFMQAVNDTLATLTEGNAILSDQTWGSRNRLSIKHPISQNIRVLNWFLDRPRHGMPGDVDSPRVQTPTFGASQRMVIDPSSTDKSIFHMPGGQSGHPLSDFYDKGFNDWVTGQPSPLTATQPIHRLILKAN